MELVKIKLCEILNSAAVLPNVTLYRRFGQASLVKEVHCVTLKNEGFTIYRKVRNCLQIDKTSYPVRQKLSKEQFAEMGQTKKKDWRTGME
jgi:hypothetical protein